MVTSGWGSDGLDIYRLSPTAAPVYDQFVRTRGYSVRSLSRQGNALYLSSGYWGVQAVALK
jgi:chromosome condensin MukBEF complex kleisin-like MukF subunit